MVKNKLSREATIEQLDLQVLKQNNLRSLLPVMLDEAQVQI
jgi:hypothetical protein